VVLRKDNEWTLLHAMFEHFVQFVTPYDLSHVYGRLVVDNYTIQLNRDELIGMLEISLDISFVCLIKNGH
jgi:hypothetical protein